MERAEEAALSVGCRGVGEGGCVEWPSSGRDG